jgi:bifunctional DNA-binding transcriptional regulator/antitoxin component of YhaV-PrlF toxin-antitoxin module
MEKTAIFDAIVNANNAITIPEATRIKYKIVQGMVLKVVLKIEE